MCFKIREILIARWSGANGREVRNRMDAVGDVGCCEKDLRLTSREFQRRGEAFQKERPENLCFELRGGGERQRRSEEPV